jgi:dihydrofolate synthase/folylpolyglutamate synthase
MPLAQSPALCFTMGMDKPFTDAFTNADEVFRYLDSFHNMERGIPARTFRLDRVEKLAELAGNPHRFCPVIHAAGSKGKGSVCAMISSILAAAGFKTGLYVSPHVEDFRERITLAGTFLSESAYAAAGDELREAVGRIGPEGLPSGEEPTYFELCTVLGFLAFRREACETAVVETGLGGRLDATNIVDPLAVILTPIELEHTEYLGDTIPLIAAEKAGIIKPGRPVYVSEQTPEALEVFRRTAGDKSAPLFYLPDEISSIESAVDRDGTDIRIVFKDRAAFPNPITARLGLVGSVQAGNAALAVFCVRRTFSAITDREISRGLASAGAPARFERILDNPPVVVDGAHTARSVGYAAATFTAAYGSGGILLFACAEGKDVAAMARILVPHFSAVYLTRPGTYRASDPDGTHKVFSAHTKEALRIDDTEKALEAAIGAAAGRGLPLLVIGSFYLAAEAKKYVRHNCLGNGGSRIMGP